MSAICRNDKKLLKYQLELDLYGEVKPFEIDEKKQADWKQKWTKYEEDFAEYKRLNATYKDDLEDYNDKLTKWQNSFSDRELAKAIKDPYGDAIPEEPEPKKPTKPVEP